jgi:hypothetical protein
MKKLTVFSISMLFVLFLMYSCKSDDDTVPDYTSVISGPWRYVSGELNEKYLQIYSNRTYSILSSDLQGLRDRSDGILQVTSNQISIELNSNYSGLVVNLYNYVLNGDSLILTKPNVRIALVKDNTAPDTTAWIKNLTIVAQTKAPVSEATDLTFDGTDIWYGNGYSSHYLYKIETTGFSVDSIPTTEYAWSVEADDTTLWVSSDGSDQVYQVGKNTGNTLFTSTSMGAWIYGIAKDNDFLWCYSGNEKTLYKYNISGNTVDLKVKTESNWEGLAMAGASLYVTANGKLHKCSLSPLMQTASFQLPGYYIYGVAYDGASFWVTAYRNYNEPEIIKVAGVE